MARRQCFLVRFLILMVFFTLLSGCSKKESAEEISSETAPEEDSPNAETPSEE